MRRYLYPIPGDPASACFGPGDHGHWSLQANNTAAAAFAVLAADPATDFPRAGMSRDEMHSWALRLIHFALTSHHAGGGAATDGQSWGHSWISALCLERLMHGLDALGPAMPEADRALLGRVLVSEADWLLDHYDVVAGLVHHNKPESNIWNGCLLHRAARLIPDAPRRAAYLDKGTRFLLNGISLPADAESREVIAGRPLAEWHVGANLFDTLACNHHGYLNIGYLVICLSNLAMLQFSCRAHGWAPPEGLEHHARDLWQLVKTCTFPDGRLWRIGGDTRVRYCYCQDYAIPAWLLARDLFGDPDVEALEHGWLDQLETEAAANPDEAFLSARLARLEAVSPQYYVRLEGDRACTLSMGVYWHRLRAAAAPAAQASPIPILTDWADEYHGSLLVRGARRLASWTWGAAQPPQGLCLPPDGSDLAEWQGNLGGRIRGLGYFNDATCRPDQHAAFPGGFATCGRVTVSSHHFVSEGDLPRDVAEIDLACVALPDDRTLVVLQRARTTGRVWLREVKGLFLQVPNDLFNGMARTYRHAGGAMALPGCPGEAEVRPIPGNWLNVAGRLGVVRLYGPDLCLSRPPDRQITIAPSPHQPYAALGGGTLYADEICGGCVVGAQAYDAQTALFDLGAVLLAGATAGETARFAQAHGSAVLATHSPDTRGVLVTGADERRYLILANFGDEEAVAPAAGRDAPQVLAGAAAQSMGGRRQLVIPPRQVAVASGLHAGQAEARP